MSKPEVLIINSYAGSLVVAATAARHPIIGSYEDAGYGIDLQQANFKDIDYRETRDQWPKKLDLRGKIVLAHPPCAAFSAQNNSPSKRGMDAPKFKCTLDVMDYTMSAKADAIAIESVPGARMGARGVHEQFARHHKYDVVRVMQNAVTFGVPQWRPRFWVIFVKKGILKDGQFSYTHKPARSVVSEILDPKPTGPLVTVLEAKLAEQTRRLKDDFGGKFMKDVLSGKRGYGMLPAVLRKALRADGKPYGSQLDVARKHCVWGFYMSQTMRLLDPASYAFTVLGISWWTVPFDGGARNLTQREWKRLMGFPAEYVVPEKRQTQLRFYLSRGVCPPVARWILDTVTDNVTGKTAKHDNVIDVARGEMNLIDLQPRSRKSYDDAARAEAA